MTADLLTTEEVSAIVRAPVASVRYWHHMGKGPKSFKIGRRRLYKREDVETWLRRQYLDQTQGMP